MSTNRLQLDFTLTYADERAQFINYYINQPKFNEHPLTPAELTTIANYVLWGVDRATGLNGRQSGLDLPSRNGNWSAKHEESLDALLESPGFNEAELSTDEKIAYAVRAEKFSRDEALASAPEHLIPEFKALFRAIDELDLKLNYYDLAHGKRTKEIRPWLANKFTPEDHQRAQNEVASWNQYRYLKERHQLIELRTNQYTLRDTYSGAHFAPNNAAPTPIASAPQFGSEIEVLPLGTISKKAAGAVPNIFAPLRDLNPDCFTQRDLGYISTLYWEKQNYKKSDRRYVDFRDTEHIKELVGMYEEMTDEARTAKFDSILPEFMETFDFYVREADLSDLQLDVLHEKIKKTRNEDIVGMINRKYGKSYSTNYISTIYTQRVIPKIAAAASRHQEIVGHLFFDEDFKVCSCCGKKLLRDSESFTRRARTQDGFMAKCKKCEKEKK